MGKKITLTCDQCGKIKGYYPDFEPSPREWVELVFPKTEHDISTKYFCGAECKAAWGKPRRLTTEDFPSDGGSGVSTMHQDRGGR